MGGISGHCIWGYTYMALLGIVYGAIYTWHCWALYMGLYTHCTAGHCIWGSIHIALLGFDLVVFSSQVYSRGIRQGHDITAWFIDALHRGAVYVGQYMQGSI